MIISNLGTALGNSSDSPPIQSMSFEYWRSAYFSVPRVSVVSDVDGNYSYFTCCSYYTIDRTSSKRRSFTPIRAINLCWLIAPPYVAKCSSKMCHISDAPQPSPFRVISLSPRIGIAFVSQCHESGASPSYAQIPLKSVKLDFPLIGSVRHDIPPKGEDTLNTLGWMVSLAPTSWKHHSTCLAKVI